MRDDRGDCTGLGYFLGFQAAALKHIHKVHIAADIKLVRAVKADTAVFKQAGHNTMGNSCPDLAFDIIADNRHPGITELLSPFRVRSNENRQAVHKTAVGIHSALGIVLICLFGADRQIADKDINLAVTQNLGHVYRFFR